MILRNRQRVRGLVVQFSDTHAYKSKQVEVFISLPLSIRYVEVEVVVCPPSLISTALPILVDVPRQ